MAAGKTTSEANFRISIDGNAEEKTKNVAASARLAAKAIEGYEAEIKTLSSDLRRLRGNSDEVNAAKKTLRDQIDRARTSVSQLTIELNKQGTSYAAAAKAAKTYGAGVGARLAVGAQSIAGKLGAVSKGAARALGGAISKAAGPAGKKLGDALGAVAKKAGDKLAPAGRVVGKFGGGAAKAIRAVGEVARPVAEKALPSLSSALSLAAAGAVTASAAILAAGAAAAGAGVAVIALAFAASAAAAKMQRQREALLGNTQDAKALGDQIGVLAGKVPQGVEELNALAVSLSKTRLSGRAIVDTMNAVAQATGAVDAAAGSKIQEIITRGQNTGRLFLGQLELQGTGLDFDDVAKAYAEGTKKSVAAARAELLHGRAPLEAGAEAIRKATEKKFGDLNVKNAFSLENAPKKFFEQFKNLISGINLKPITDGLQKAFEALNPDSPLGKALGTLVSTVGNDLAAAAGKGIPVLVEGFKWLIVGALRVATHFYELKARIKETFATEGWVGVGKQIVAGLIEGITGYWKFAAEAITSLAKNIKGAFTGELEIHSPSKAFKRYGEDTTEGYVQGVDRGAKRATGAVQSMVEMPAPPAGGGGAAGGARSETIEVHFHGAPVGDAQAMQSPVLLAAITRAVREARTAVAA